MRSAYYLNMDTDYSWTARIPLCRTGNVTSDEEIVCGFKFWVNCNIKQAAVGSMCEMKLCYAPCEGCESYRLLVDYRLLPKFGDQFQRNETMDCLKSCKPTFPCLHAQFELVDGTNCLKDNSTRNENRKELFLTLSRDNLLKFCGKAGENAVCLIEIYVKVRDMLPRIEEKFEEQSGSRNFVISIAEKSFYVDLSYLAELDCDYFRNLMELKRNKELTQHTIRDIKLDSNEFADFLDAVCTYRKPVVTAKNFHSVLNVASLLQVPKALRACEYFLSQCKSIHPIRKLEISVNHGFGLLGESIVKKLCDEESLDFGHLCALHEYMELNDEFLTEQNVDVLEALNVFDDFVVA